MNAQSDNRDAGLDLEIHLAARRDDRYPLHLRLGDGQDFAGDFAAPL
ncbi:MAG TPA: hypothetical protein PKH77_09765 [Anaerolineae bacterium]|nr:hypothetical protein [Anaerolineae bacterium]